MHQLQQEDYSSVNIPPFPFSPLLLLSYPPRGYAGQGTESRYALERTLKQQRINEPERARAAFGHLCARGLRG